MAAPQAGDSFDVRFHLGSRNWPANPFHFQGPGQVAVEPDFITVRGATSRSFRLPKREQHRVRMVDIVNVRVEGDDVIFDVVGVRDNKDLVYTELGFTTSDRPTAQRLAALLPDRQTEEFKTAYAEREAFHDRIDYWSPSTPVLYALLAVDIGVYLLMAWQRWSQHVPLVPALLGLDWGHTINPVLLAHVQSVQFTQWGANAGRLTLHGQPWRLLTSMFVHANIIHLLLNMIGLWQVGSLVERIFGSLRFSGLYLLAGLVGGLVSMAFHPGGETLGASGALFGIMGGLLAFIGRKDSGVPPTIVQALRTSIGPVLLLNIAVGFAFPRIDNAAHIGGLVGGWLAGHLLARSIHVPEQREG
jgi:membrane associated rhomboid family serine protease